MGCRTHSKQQWQVCVCFSCLRCSNYYVSFIAKPMVLVFPILVIRTKKIKKKNSLAPEKMIEGREFRTLLSYCAAVQRKCRMVRQTIAVCNAGHVLVDLNKPPNITK